MIGSPASGMFRGPTRLRPECPLATAPAMAISPAQFVLLFTGLALLVLGLLWLIAVAFQASFVRGLFGVVFPPSLALTARKSWDLACEPVGLLATGGVLAGAVALIHRYRGTEAVRTLGRAEAFLFREQTLVLIVALGMLLVLIGFIGLVLAAFRERAAWGIGVLVFPPLGLLFPIRHWRAGRGPLGLLVLGAIVAAVPFLITRMPVDLGPLDRQVNGERHLTLTGWDRQDYNVLSECRDAVVLQMANPDVTDDTVALLAGFDRLRELDLNTSRVTDAGLATLARLPKLQTLRLRGTPITDLGFRAHLMPMPSLRRLELRDTAVTPEAVAAWKAAGPDRRAQR